MANQAQVSKKRKFVADGVLYAELNEFLMRTWAEDGYAGVEVEESKISIDFNDVPATRQGIAAGTPVATMREATDTDEHRLTINLGLGEASATVYTTDLNKNFVEFNLLD